MSKMSDQDNSEANRKANQDEMRPEYDFSGGVRGKHHRAYSQGHKVRIHQPDGSIVEQRFTLEEGAILIDPDIREYFPNAEAVNNALRGLIALFPKGRL